MNQDSARLLVRDRVPVQVQIFFLKFDKEILVYLDEKKITAEKENDPKVQLHTICMSQ